ncbi:sulfatase-like hydrolase/transferase [Puniceicoccaceae bacterium K14]|nr:sulfatase-like hydrolase/transferase [Puniceicoccaceae bacterium K14]
MNIRELRQSLALFIAMWFACAQSCVAEERPNILLLLADDMGYGELGCYGQQMIKTPNIDKLAQNGIRFTDFYAGTSVCSPSRASLQTGKHLGHTTIRGNRGIWPSDRWARVPLRHDERTLGDVLRGAGYETAFIGKWHLDVPDDPSTWAFARGFDFAVQPQSGEGFEENVHYVGNRLETFRYEWKDNDCIDSFRTDIALDYLDDRTWERPLFLVMSYRSPHPREQEIRDRSMYSDRGWPESERVHAARITMLDEQVGRLLERLEEMGELENTLVLFTSDNGPHREKGHDHEFFDSNGKFRGHKRDVYEGGIRVPLIASWPRKIKEGSVSIHVSAFWDVMATIRDVVGLEALPEADGLSFLPALLGEEQPVHDHLYWGIQLDGRWNDMRNGGFRQAVRQGDWKAVRYGIANPIELYNLSEDPSESRNIVASHRALGARLGQLMYREYDDSSNFPWGGVPSEGPTK